MQLGLAPATRQPGEGGLVSSWKKATLKPAALLLRWCLNEKDAIRRALDTTRDPVKSKIASSGGERQKQPITLLVCRDYPAPTGSIRQGELLPQQRSRQPELERINLEWDHCWRGKQRLFVLENTRDQVERDTKSAASIRDAKHSWMKHDETLMDGNEKTVRAASLPLRVSSLLMLMLLSVFEPADGASSGATPTSR